MYYYYLKKKSLIIVVYGHIKKEKINNILTFIDKQAYISQLICKFKV